MSSETDIKGLICKQFKIDQSTVTEDENLFGSYITSFGLIKLINLIEGVLGHKISEHQMMLLFTEEVLSFSNIRKLIQSFESEAKL